MMVIGICGGVLLATGEPWSNPSFLRLAGNLLFGRPAHFSPATSIGTSTLILGESVAALAGGRFVLRAISATQVMRSLAGGTLMGLAAVVIPGGNVVLLLSALPSLASHGAIALSRNALRSNRIGIRS